MREYLTADAAYAGLRARAKELVRREGGTVDEWWHRFLFQRFLARVFIADPDGWFLKGGQALLVRNRGSRSTRDIDLYRDIPGNRDDAVAALRQAAQLDLDDFIRFEFARRDDHPDENRVSRATFAVIFGRRRHNDIGVDIAISPPPLGDPERKALRPAIAIDWPQHWPEVTLFPLVDHVADKITAMYEIRQGRPSTRWRDLIDLVLIATVGDRLDGRVLQAALQHQVAYRGERATVINLPRSFRLPSREWEGKYAQIAASITELDRYRTFQQALPLLQAFLDPVLSGERIATWMPDSAAWSRLT